MDVEPLISALVLWLVGGIAAAGMILVAAVVGQWLPGARTVRRPPPVGGAPAHDRRSRVPLASGAPPVR